MLTCMQQEQLPSLRTHIATNMRSNITLPLTPPQTHTHTHTHTHIVCIPAHLSLRQTPLQNSICTFSSDHTEGESLRPDEYEQMKYLSHRAARVLLSPSRGSFPFGKTAATAIGHTAPFPTLKG